MSVAIVNVLVVAQQAQIVLQRPKSCLLIKKKITTPL